MAHALLSPSAAHRWLNCTAAPRLEENVPDTSSTFAQEGSLAHAYCAKALKEFIGISTEGEDAEIEELKDLYSGEMDEHVDTYKTIVLEKFNRARAATPDAQLLVETTLDLQRFVPDAFGTADAIIIADGTMEVIDFKYGKGVKVDATENPQMKIYALGAVQMFSFEYNIKNVKMTIVQPRIDNLSEYELTVGELITWASMVLVPKAQEAYSGKGEQKAGAWCQFCKVKATCRALAGVAISTAKEHNDPRLVTAEEMATLVLPNIELIKSWLKGVEDYTLEQALNGTHYNGFKLVEGRSIRKIADAAKVEELLKEQGYDDAAIMKPAELKGLTDLEKTVGKKAFATLCGEYIVKPAGKPTLVPESDKRPEYNSAKEDFRDF